MAIEKKTVAGSSNRKTTAVKTKKASAGGIKAGKADQKAVRSTATGKKSSTAPKKKPADANGNKSGMIRITFLLRYSTHFGQDLFITGNHPMLGNNDPALAMPMTYFNEQYWMAQWEIPANQVPTDPVIYHYQLREPGGTISYDWGNDKVLTPAIFKKKDIHINDAWNHAGYYENTFYTEPFTQVLLKQNHTPVTVNRPRTITHTLQVKAPLLQQGQTLCIMGSEPLLGQWDTQEPLLLQRAADEDFFRIDLNLSKASFPIAYKYGIYDVNRKQFVRWEDGNNRVLQEAPLKGRYHLINDGFAILPNQSWKGAGVAIPVFSLRTRQSFGVGEFADLKTLSDWAVQTGLKMIQLLPVNDTTATGSWMDSYPYAAISAFALHPLYLHIASLLADADPVLLTAYQKQQAELNALPVVDYEAVMQQKMQYIRVIFEHTGKQTLASADYLSYFEQNKHWLVPYAAFCYLRDEYGTVNFSEWGAYASYRDKEINALASPKSAAYPAISLHYFIQYQLHLQLKEATAYAHAHGIIVKGDIAIGVYRHGADAWQRPDLYHMDVQAGAPPDDFAVTGQNWGFPTYHWEHMQADGYAWWKQRFEQMSYYFDAFRIDHILGFFRIWSIPMHAVEGIMGHFVPAIPVHVNEIQSRGISFDLHRFTKPFISEKVLWEIFGYDNELIKKEFLDAESDGLYTLKPGFETQREVEAYFAGLEDDEHHQRIRQGLYNLISNVILFQDTTNDHHHFHFRIGMEQTSSFRHLDAFVQEQLRDLYLDYFYRRQDDFWKKEALQKLPALKRVTNMMVCGEDLGMVPACVPDVMQQLGLLSLEIQRMPKDASRSFFHPNDAPYLSVVTPSTHDMSTIRGWWEEDQTRTQQFYQQEMGQWGEAPYYCEAWINRTIVLQHLYSPAMWSIFQLQDLLGMDAALRRENPQEERINIPANPKHYWQYRMHKSIEELIDKTAFNTELKAAVIASGR